MIYTAWFRSILNLLKAFESFEFQMVSKYCFFSSRNCKKRMIGTQILPRVSKTGTLQYLHLPNDVPVKLNPHRPWSWGVEKTTLFWNGNIKITTRDPSCQVNAWKNNLAGWYFTIPQIDGTIHKSMHKFPKTQAFSCLFVSIARDSSCQVNAWKQSSRVALYNGAIQKSMHNNPKKNMPFHAPLSPSLETHPVKLMHEKQSSGTVLYNFTNRWHNPQINAQVPKNPCLFMSLCLHRSRPILSS